VRSGVSPVVLKNLGKSEWSRGVEAVDRYQAARVPDASAVRLPFLRIPPFPGAVVRRFAEVGCASAESLDLVDAIKRFRVGGAYWGARPQLPKNCVLARSCRGADFASRRFGQRSLVIWSDDGDFSRAPQHQATLIGDCDPWHVLSFASTLVVEPEDELRVIAALMGVSCYVVDPDQNGLEKCAGDAATLLSRALTTTFVNPFGQQPMSPLEAIELCGFWRGIVDSNRSLAGGIGFAFWKQKHIGALLWGGTDRFSFLRSADEVSPGAQVAAWRAKSPSKVLTDLIAKGATIVEVEDGFLRSRGLGSDCVPPLSITVDHLGAHFDPASPSELENLLETAEFDARAIARASKLRSLIVAEGIAKYQQGTEPFELPPTDRRVVLVPGQVEDDRAVKIGGCGLISNLDLLKRVREQAPDAYVIYKPHPDVTAGHRRGRIPEKTCLRYADQVVGDSPIASVIAAADEVHVNTSLAGFEALMRGKSVTTYGVPFYAGWGLTRDLGPVPERRTKRRTIDDLVAAALLIYPRYLDPITGLPCPPEVVVDRLARRDADSRGFVISARRLQGKFMRRLRSMVE
jgi:capsular polysaccharide export protein